MKAHTRVASAVTVIMIAACLFSLAGTSVVHATGPAKAVTKSSPVPQGQPLLVDVGADKCIPCKMMAPVLEDLKKEYAGILEVRFVDAWKYPEEADKYHVKGIPTQIFYDVSGKELGRHMGFIDKEGIIKGFQELGVTLKKPSGKPANHAQ